MIEPFAFYNFSLGMKNNNKRMAWFSLKHSLVKGSIIKYNIINCNLFNGDNFLKLTFWCSLKMLMRNSKQVECSPGTKEKLKLKQVEIKIICENKNRL